jgi:serine/threonine protein kinase
VTSTGGRLPERIGPYEVRELIGAGGMGVVYRAVSPAGEQLAVKQIRSHHFTAEERARFAAEIEALKTVFGPRIVSYVDGDAEASEPWLAVQYVPGATLREQVGTHGPLEPVLVAILGAALAEGLATIHREGLLHRDLKPHNIILAYDGPVVIDFGLALLTRVKVEAAESPRRLTAPGTVVGTLLCMPPEQVRAEALTPAADVYALGATLLYAATGHYPFTAESEYGLMQQIGSATTQPDLSDLPPVLRPVVVSMLGKTAADRPPLPEVTAALVEVVTGAGFTAMRARELLRRTTASGVRRLPDADSAGAGEDLPAGWRAARPARRVGELTGGASAPGALRAARRLRDAYARSGQL